MIRLLYSYSSRLLSLFLIMRPTFQNLSYPLPLSQKLNLRHILPLTLNQLVESAILHPAQRERTFFRQHEHALHLIAFAFPVSDPTQHHLIPFSVLGPIFPACGFFIQHTEKFAFKVYPVGLVLQPRCNVRGGFADEGGFEGRWERSLGGFLTAAFRQFLGGCLQEGVLVLGAGG